MKLSERPLNHFTSGPRNGPLESVNLLTLSRAFFCRCREHSREPTVRFRIRNRWGFQKSGPLPPVSLEPYTSRESAAVSAEGFEVLKRGPAIFKCPSVQPPVKFAIPQIVLNGVGDGS